MNDDAPHIAPTDLRQRQTGASEARREHAVSVDRELIPLPKAQKLCTAMFIAGCFLLPWFWFTNVWLFWPYVTRQRRNAVIEKYTLYSAVGFAAVTPFFLSWMLLYMIGYDRVFSEEFVDKIDATRINLRSVGWVF